MADIVIAVIIVASVYAASVAIGLLVARRLFPKHPANVWVYGNMVGTDQTLSDEQVRRIREEIAKVAPAIARHAARAVEDRSRRA